MLISFNADVNAFDSNRWTALMKASKHGYAEIVDILLENKADKELKNINGETSLIWGLLR